MKILSKLTFSAILLAVFSFYSCKKEAKILPVNNPVKANVAAATKLVLFPGAGWVPADQVHFIEPGSYLTIYNGHYLKMAQESNRIMQDYGKFRNQDIANSSNNSPQSNTGSLSTSFNSRASGPIPIAGGTNWVTYAQWALSGTATINYFSTSWTVPGVPPTNHQQTIFIFNALTDINVSDILQPVLQWGINSSAGGGNYWSVVNVYYAPPLTVGAPGFYAYSSAIQVSAGSTLQGVMTSNIQPDGSYTYNSSFTGFSNPLALQAGVTPRGANVFFKDSYPFAPTIPQLNTASETIEVYGANHGAPPALSSDYPSDNVVRMSGIHITTASNTPTLSWTGTNIANNLGQHTVVVNNNNPNGIVDLYLHGVTIPIISYTTPHTYTKGTAITSLSPVNTGGTPTIYSISPALPPGLIFTTATGVISGNPSAASPSTNYVITATNSAGSSTFTLNISVILPGINFNITNNSDNGLSITFSRTDQSQSNISLVCQPHSGTSTITIPAGIYNINYNPSGQPVNCTVTLSDGRSNPNAPGGSFTNVTIGNGSVISMTAN